jgi:UDP-N-acetylglucosamine 1-carboxyvinyltransferase
MAVTDKLEEMGVQVIESGDALRVRCDSRPRGASVTTEPYPGFPTDLQPVFTALLATADGESTVEESIFDNRMQCAKELAKMGATVELTDSRRAVITGVHPLHGAEVEAHNIRDGAALVVAALSAEGESCVSGRSYVARGYQDLDGKLRSLGAAISAAAG